MSSLGEILDRNLKPHKETSSETLTDCQKEIIRLKVRGWPASKIWQKLNLTPQAYRYQKRVVTQKTKCRTTQQLSRYAIANGIDYSDLKILQTCTI